MRDYSDKAAGRGGVELTRQKFAWAMYDWANSAFATIVIAGFFPVFFKQYWNAGVPVTESTFRLGLVNSIASLASKVLVAMHHEKKRFVGEVDFITTPGFLQGRAYCRLC